MRHEFLPRYLPPGGRRRSEVITDIGTCPDPGYEKSFAHQPVVGDADGITRHLQAAGEFASRWHCLAGSQPPVKDRGTKSAVDLVGQAVPAYEVDV
jgi:hypothetical protein